MRVESFRCWDSLILMFLNCSIKVLFYMDLAHFVMCHQYTIYVAHMETEVKSHSTLNSWKLWLGLSDKWSTLNYEACVGPDGLWLHQFKVGTSGYGNLQTMSTDKWATSKSTQLSTKIWVNCSFCLKMPQKIEF